MFCTYVAIATITSANSASAIQGGTDMAIEESGGSGMVRPTGLSDQRRPRSKRRLRSGGPLQPLVGPRFANQSADDHPRGHWDDAKRRLNDPVHRATKSKQSPTFMAPVQLVVGRHSKRIYLLNWKDDGYILRLLSPPPADW
jgi:hypothetical protein